MVELDVVIANRKVRHVGIFDFRETYRYAYMWFIDEGYDLIEKNYTEKLTSRGKEIEIEWLALRKISDYFRFRIEAKWRIANMADTEVMEEGKKIRMNSGDLEVRFKAILEKDYEHRWEGNAFFKFLRGLYDKYIIRARIEQYEQKIFFEVEDIMSQIKSYLLLSMT